MTLRFGYLPNNVASLVAPNMISENKFPITQETISNFDTFVGYTKNTQDFFLYKDNTVWGILWDPDTHNEDKPNIISCLKLWHLYTTKKTLKTFLTDCEDFEYWNYTNH